MLSALRLSDVRRLAGLSTFRRAEAAYEQGQVGRVRRRGNHLHGEVLGGRHGAHRVEIRDSPSDLRMHCNCASADDDTCEHIAAVLLWWLEEGREPRRTGCIGLEDVDRALGRLPRRDLVDLLLGFAMRDDGILNVLELKATASSRKPVDTSRYKQMIRNALSSKFVDYYHTGDYLRNLEALRDDLDRLREAGQAGTAHDLFAYLLEKALDRYREVEDVDLRFAATLHGMIDSYGAALAAAGIGRAEAASEVFYLIDSADAGFLERIVRAAAPGLAAKGLAALEALARDRFEAAGEARGPVRPTVSRRKFAQLLKAIARAEGDEGKYLALLREGLEGSTDFLLAAERLAGLGRVDEATRLAREGLQASPRRDPRLLALLSSLSERDGDPRAALRHAREAFEETPTADLLRRVQHLARQLGRWGQTFEELATRLAREPGSPLLLELLLEEGRLDDIVQAVRRGQWPEGLLEKVARRTEAASPAHAASLYQALVERHLARPGEGDRHAAAALHELADLWRRGGDAGKLKRYLGQLRRRLRSRRPLLTRLEAAAAP